MSDQKATSPVSTIVVDRLLDDLQHRMMLVTDQTLTHLKSHGAAPSAGVAPALLRADGCCKPDGGTCCVNKKLF